MLDDEAGQISDLPLQGGDLGLQNGHLLGQREQSRLINKDFDKDTTCQTKGILMTSSFLSLFL